MADASKKRELLTTIALVAGGVVAGVIVSIAIAKLVQGREVRRLERLGFRALRVGLDGVVGVRPHMDQFVEAPAA